MLESNVDSIENNMTVDQAEDLLDRHHTAFPTMESHYEKIQQLAQQTGCVYRVGNPLDVVEPAACEGPHGKDLDRQVDNPSPLLESNYQMNYPRDQYKLVLQDMITRRDALFVELESVTAELNSLCELINTLSRLAGEIVEEKGEVRKSLVTGKVRGRNRPTTRNLVSIRISILSILSTGSVGMDTLCTLLLERGCKIGSPSFKHGVSTRLSLMATRGEVICDAGYWRITDLGKQALSYPY